jgi:hypothetical protein
MEQQALGLLAIEFLHGARGALGALGHGSCDPSFAVLRHAAAELP